MSRRTAGHDTDPIFERDTGGKVITEAAHCLLLGLRPDSGPHRYSATYMIVQVGLGPALVSLEEAVSAVPRNEDLLHAGSDRAGQLGHERGPGVATVLLPAQPGLAAVSSTVLRGLSI
jgi:hypothetical protein